MDTMTMLHKIMDKITILHMDTITMLHMDKITMLHIDTISTLHINAIKSNTLTQYDSQCQSPINITRTTICTAYCNIYLQYAQRTAAHCTCKFSVLPSRV